MGLVAVGRLYKHVEPRRQLQELKIPGHEELVSFAIKHLLRAGAKLRNGKLADAACKLLIGSSFDRCCEYNISEHFDVCKACGLDPGWAPPPEDAPLYGVGVAISSGPSPLSGLRVVAMLSNTERWLVAEVAFALLGTAVCGADDGSHKLPATPPPLREALLRCLSDPAAGELAGVMAAVVVNGLNAGCEHPGALLRSGLCTALVKAWRDESRPLTSALSAYALAVLAEDANSTHYRPWANLQSEEEIEKAEVPASAASDPETWRAKKRRSRRSALLMKEEYEAGVDMFRQELEAAGLQLPPSRRKQRGGG
mmetsp:Transcript_44480/g.90793  ORF Transcript_44480/g.90793 Transcript_44480/m.90793 type:complete len:311 (-) Transcript_44480:404-1336(-)